MPFTTHWKLQHKGICHSIYFLSGVLGMTEEGLKKIRKQVLAGVLLVSIFCGIISFGNHLSMYRTEKSKEGYRIGSLLKKEMEKSFFLLPDYFENGKEQGGLPDAMEEAMLRELPIYHYMKENDKEKETEDTLIAQMLKGKEGSDEDKREIEEKDLDYGEDALHIENSMLEEMQRESGRFKEKQQQEEKREVEDDSTAEDKNTVKAEPKSFERPEYPAYTYDWSEQWGYEELVTHFYAVDKTTELSEKYMKLDNLLYQDLTIDKSKEGPQILIYHTHSQEGFADSVPGDASTTIVGAGERLTALLEEEYGFSVLHHTGEYDVENRDYAYSNSLSAIETILKANPSIQVVIDLHRDEMREGKKLVMDLQGRPTARFMFFNGMSHIRKKGDIGYLENPYIQDNLAFSFQAQVAANEYYPGIARKIYLKAYRYNLHLKPKSLLIELGAQTNTVEEIMNACDPLAHILFIVLGKEM